MNIGIDHGYSAIKTRHFSFPAGISLYSSEPYTLQNTLEFEGKFHVCGTGRQPILRDKTENDNYYLLTLAGHRQRNPAARRQNGVLRLYRRRPTPGFLRAGEEGVPGLSPVLISAKRAGAGLLPV